MANQDSNATHDQLHRFLFQNQAVRGELVTLSDTYQQVLENHHYPAPVKTLLGELLVATSLLTATLKFDGDITVQIQGDGPLKMAVVNGNNRQEMRGVARVQEEAAIAPESTLKQMIGNGYLVITITPAEGERYQGVVGLEGDTVAECLENYFLQSEQLPTRLFIRTGEADGKPAAAGMLLQVLPAQNASTDDFDHLTQLTATVKNEELFGLPAHEVLYRLYHQEEATVYEPQSVCFRCSCSRERCANALRALPDEDLQSILEEEGQIDMHCDYCGADYVFDKVDVGALRNAGNEQNPQIH
ncbi:Hsp33 family molecular chaperone HslO [Chimaeribacter arupi]|jgi:molecular chaperone Hsp33|uniref:33 kDa chaperonin n=2 Tax=Yersiniaceae TaxID=1903411 RepID=A0A2N5EPA0_9GAMM|nr:MULTISPECIES: Hsp33 family molecular chaperone HslO [Yersiniaceae]MBS0968085.1 Hsp33 family molecular chaperone HslO [Nissabacter archeti]MDV5140705.1 Hsp33 family molecular chaperone HslO [Chimaeribacter arupi]PLR33853.1 Hsp33 family molecular chaperone HslO [Chimaeribacter arupi]PLR50342.1 Hsp33 family molecular chaperone HslO [Chimaeribacter arupi]PLR51117.1 Hsp33 family molecular chaperone HslO [Chimaeribacter arupi]